MDQHHLLAAKTALLGLLGGVTKIWRFDRMSPVLKSGMSDLTPMFVAFSRHHAVSVVACQPARATAEGVAEKNNHTAAERLAPLTPSVFPMVVTEERTATWQPLIDWRGNRCSFPPELVQAKVLVHQKLGSVTIHIATVSGVVLARHRIPDAGLGITI